MPTKSAIVSAFLVDAATKKVVAEIVQGTDYDLSTISKMLTIRVDTVEPVSHVRFQWIANGKLIKHTERLSPYVMAGELSDAFIPVPYLATEGIKMVAVDVFLKENVILERKVLFFDMTASVEVKPDGLERPDTPLSSLLQNFLDTIGSVFPRLAG